MLLTCYGILLEQVEFRIDPKTLPPFLMKASFKPRGQMCTNPFREFVLNCDKLLQLSALPQVRRHPLRLPWHRSATLESCKLLNTQRQMTTYKLAYR